MVTPLRDWLRSLDAGGALDRYLSNISQHFSSAEEVARSYVVQTREGPVFDDQFFEDMDVSDPDHQTVLQRWFEAQERPSARVRSAQQQQQQQQQRQQPQHQQPVPGPRGQWAWGGTRPAELRGQGLQHRSVAAEEDGWARESSRGSDSEAWARRSRWGASSQSWWSGYSGWGWGGAAGWTQESDLHWWERDSRPAGAAHDSGQSGQESSGSRGRTATTTPLREGGRGAVGQPSPSRQHQDQQRPPSTLRSTPQGRAATPSGRTATPSRRGGRRREESAARQPSALEEWLRSLDSSGVLCRYRSPLEDFFENAEQVFLAYTTPADGSAAPRFDEGFFLEAGISDGAHRRVLQQWFESKLQAPVQVKAAPSESRAVTPNKKQAGQAEKSPGRTGGFRPARTPSSSSRTAKAAAKPAQWAAKTVHEDVPQTKTEAKDSVPSRPDPSPARPPRTASTPPPNTTQVKQAEQAADAAPAAPLQESAETTSPAPAQEASTVPATEAAAPEPPAAQSPAPKAKAASAAEVPRAQSEEPAAASRDAKGREEQRQASELATKLRSVKEAAQALPDPDPRAHFAVAFLGHTGAGKSALMGALLRVGGAWDRRAFEKFLKEQSGASSSSTSPSTRVEPLPAEGRRLTLLDPPGQRRSVAQTWAALAQADMAVLVVPAVAAELEASLAKGGQAREHAALAKSVGIDNLIVAVNKMDVGQWCSTRYEEVRGEILVALRTAGYRDEQMSFLPVSATTSDNVGGEEDEDCQACAGWYSGGTLLELLEMSPVPVRSKSGPLRVSVLGREKRGNATIVSCRVEQGELEAGAVLCLVPTGGECGVQALEVNTKEVRRAVAGEHVQLRLLGTQPAPGQVLCGTDEPLRAAAKFKAQIRLLELTDEQPAFTAGFRCVLHLHQVTEEVEVSKLLEAVDPRTKRKEAAPKIVRAPMVALCILIVSSGREVPVEADNGRFARLCLRSDAGTIAIGKAVELPKAK